MGILVGAAGSRWYQILERISEDFVNVLICMAMLLVPITGESPYFLGTTTNCGGVLTARRGIISTPNFPGPFPVPIHCLWIIDSSEYSDQDNASIIIYLNQLYVARGLRFTEYAYYEFETTSFGGALLRNIDESNMFENRWLRTFRPYLVLEFRLQQLEGNHVRILDQLLEVYGFNFTYEVTEGRENPTPCSLQDCSFAGDCILSSDYTKFYCDCFEGFSGQHCGFGPLCVTKHGSPICQNSGICRHIGAAAVRCLCKPPYKGDFCEISPHVDGENGCRNTNCIFQCPFPENQAESKKIPCACRKPIRPQGDRSRFECRIKLTNVTNPRDIDFIRYNISLETYLNKQRIRPQAANTRSTTWTTCRNSARMHA